MANIQYTSLLRSTAADNKLAKTDQLFDDQQEKFQQDINKEVAEAITDLSIQVLENADSSPVWE